MNLFELIANFWRVDEQQNFTGKISLESLLKLMHVVGRLNEISSILTVDENREDIEKLFTK